MNFTEVSELLTTYHLRSCSTGSSGACAYIIEHSDHLYAVKIAHNNRVSLDEEMKRRSLLERYMPTHVPKILSYNSIDNYEIMITQTCTIDNFHSQIANGKWTLEQSIQIWEDVISEVEKVWCTTKKIPYDSYENPRQLLARYSKIYESVTVTRLGNYVVNDILDYVVWINGTECCSISALLDQLKHINDLEFSVFCHGDIQPTNIIVGDDLHWYLVDWEWCGYGHDWRMMIAHLWGWWITRFTYLLNKPEVDISQKKIKIHVKEYIPEYIACFQSAVKSLAERMIERHGSVIDVTAINKYLALLYLGEIRYLVRHKRENYVVQLLASALQYSNRQHYSGFYYLDI